MLPGWPAPLGATPRDGGTNFAVTSGLAEAVELCLFDHDGTETRVRLPEYEDGVRHGFLPGTGPGQAYGYRVHGPWDPGRGLRCNPAKLLLDPYARAVHGEVTFGPEVFDYDAADPDTPSSLDSAGHVPRSIVADSMFRWGADEPRRRSYSDTVIYEVHVKGLTMRHPGVPEALRGTYAGLAHEAVIDHLTRLGVTAVELLPVHEYVPEEFLLQRGLTNYWGYNSVGLRRPGPGRGRPPAAGRRLPGPGERVVGAAGLHHPADPAGAGVAPGNRQLRPGPGDRAAGAGPAPGRGPRHRRPAVRRRAERTAAAGPGLGHERPVRLGEFADRTRRDQLPVVTGNPDPGGQLFAGRRSVPDHMDPRGGDDHHHHRRHQQQQPGRAGQ